MAATEGNPPDLARNVLEVLCILGLTAVCLKILSPFLTAVICAATIAIATWPMLNGLQRRLGGNRGLAIAVLMAALTLAFVIPIYFGVMTAIQSMGALSEWVRGLSQRPLPPLPDWLVSLPVLGARIQTAWSDLAAGGSEGIRSRLSENSNEIMRWLIVRLGNFAGMLAQVLVTLGITAAMYVRGEQVAAVLLRFFRRLAGANGERAARLAALATRGVALGVVLTPLIQAILAGIGMAIAGVPSFGLLAAIVLVSCLAQAGPIPALLLPVIWLYARGATLPATLLLGWALVIHITGPVLRPLLIKRGVDLPFSLILSGVIGGVMAFGVVGLFLGPVLLAVGATLLENWMADERLTGGTGQPGPTVER